MKELPSLFNKPKSIVIHIFGVTILFFLFILIYKPEDTIAILSGNTMSFSFNLSITLSITLVSIIITRLIYYIMVRHSMKVTYFSYILWMLIEMAVICNFLALYFRLTAPGGNYFEVIGNVSLNFAPILLIPYLLIFLCLQIQVFHTESQTTDQSKIRFYDDKHILKFITSVQSVLYVEADENYINIVYVDGEKIKEFNLRSSMKSIEEVCSRNRILRCHRSFYVNVNHIHTIHKEKDGIIYAEIDHSGAKSIPVSPRYYPHISEAFRP